MTAYRSARIFRNVPRHKNESLTNAVLPEVEHLKGKIGEGEFELLRVVLNRNADVFLTIKRLLVVVILSSTSRDRKKRLSPHIWSEAHDTS